MTLSELLGRLNKESSPEVIESERQINALLTEKVEQLCAEKDLEIAKLKEYKSMLNEAFIIWTRGGGHGTRLHEVMQRYANARHADKTSSESLERSLPIGTKLYLACGEQIGWLNTKYKTFLTNAEYADTVRNKNLIFNGEVIRVYAAPPELPSAELMIQTLESLDSIYGKDSYARMASAILELLKKGK